MKLTNEIDAAKKALLKLIRTPPTMFEGWDYWTATITNNQLGRIWAVTNAAMGSHWKLSAEEKTKLGPKPKVTTPPKVTSFSNEVSVVSYKKTSSGFFPTLAKLKDNAKVDYTKDVLDRVDRVHYTYMTIISPFLADSSEPPMTQLIKCFTSVLKLLYQADKSIVVLP